MDKSVAVRRLIMSRPDAALIVACLTLTLAVVAAFSSLTAAEQPNRLARQTAGSANGSSTIRNVRLTIRDVGPDTGFSGSGTGFTFNRDTRQVILPSPRRVFRSLNGGNDWAAVDFALASPRSDAEVPEFPITEGSAFVRQDPRNPGVLYAVGAHGGQLGRSGDFGTTWTQLEDSRPGRIYNFADIAVHERSSNVLLALRKASDELEGPALWRSEDSGSTFTPQWDAGLPQVALDGDTGEGCFPSYSNIATTPADPDVVYVVQRFGDAVQCPAGIHKSTDGGLTFARLEATPPEPLQVFLHPTQAGVLFVQTANPINSAIHRSTDGGASFRLVTGGLGSQNSFVSFDRRNPSGVYVAGRNGVFRSQDGGETFRPLGLTADQIGRFASNVNVDPSDSSVVYVNTFNGNFKSADGGVTFHAINNGWKAAFVRAIGFDHHRDPNLYLATDHGILRTRTRGRQFEPVPHPSQLNDTIRLAFARSDPYMMLAATSVPSVNASFTERLYRTLDAGRSWVEATVGDISDPDNFHPLEISVDPYNSNSVYFTAQGEPSDNGFYRSVDAGATFERTVRTNFSALAVDPIRPNVIFGGLACSSCPWPLQRSLDGGLSFAWTSPSMGFSQVVTGKILIDPQNSDSLVLHGGPFFFSLDIPDRADHYVFRSTDGGATLSPVDEGLPRDPSGRRAGCSELVMNPVDSLRLYCWTGTPFGLAWTRDGGKNWNSVPVEEIVKVRGFGDTPTMMLINPKRPTLLYLLGSSLLEIEIHED